MAIGAKGKPAKASMGCRNRGIVQGVREEVLLCDAGPAPVAAMNAIAFALRGAG